MDEVLRAKAEAGLRATGLTLALAREGSYGPHPQIPFIAAGLEKMILIDAENGPVIVEQYFDHSPTFQRWVTPNAASIESRIEAIGFPEQAVFVIGTLAERLANRLRVYAQAATARDGDAANARWRKPAPGRMAA